MGKDSAIVKFDSAKRYSKLERMNPMNIYGNPFYSCHLDAIFVLLTKNCISHRNCIFYIKDIKLGQLLQDIVP